MTDTLLDLFQVRDRDPETSWAAAAGASTASQTSREAVLEILSNTTKPLTDDDIYARYRDAGGKRTPSRLRTARKELTLTGAVRRANVTGLSQHGNKSETWEIRS